MSNMHTGSPVLMDG